MTDSSDSQKNSNRPKGPGVLRVIQSIAAGALGVQSSKRREEDFSSHSPWPYILGAVLFTAGFIGTLVLIVHAVLSGH